MTEEDEKRLDQIRACTRCDMDEKTGKLYPCKSPSVEVDDPPGEMTGELSWLFCPVCVELLFAFAHGYFPPAKGLKYEREVTNDPT